MPTMKQRKHSIIQKRKSHTKNRGGKAAFSDWGSRIRSAQRIHNVDSGVHLASSKKALFDTKNEHAVERSARGLIQAKTIPPLLRRSTLAILAHIRRHSDPTYFHSLRVGLLTRYLFEQLQRDSSTALLGGVLHDTGKLINSHELFSGRKVTLAEYEQIKTHSERGYELLIGSEDFLSFTQGLNCAGVAGLHHQFQSNGYGAKVNLLKERMSPGAFHELVDLAQAVALADFIDAAITRRRQTHITLKLELQGLSLEEMLRKSFPKKGEWITILMKSPLLKQLYARDPRKSIESPESE